MNEQQTGVFLHDWSESKMNGMIADFADINYVDNKEERVKQLKETTFAGVNVLLASYNYECYSGDAFVLFEKDGKLYEVNGGHCSCYGLEGQWEPEETTVEALRHRMTEGRLGYSDYNRFAAELATVLDQYQAERQG